jgi:WD40 repeat protein
MAETSPCPTADRLRLLLAADPPAAEQTALLAHVDDCAACQQTLEGLAGADPALLVAAGAARDRPHDDDHLRRVLQDITDNPDAALECRPYNPLEWVRPLLKPAEAPGVLGLLDGYEVTGLIGQGGMGVVLKANDPRLKRPVAIKVLGLHLANDPVARQRFAREAQAAAAVRHPHVITIHAVSEANGLPFLVMEHVAGGSLQDHLGRHGPLDWRAAARLGAEIASGLAAAHARGQVHRDIKPSNVLLQSDGSAAGPGSVKISDFGLARVADDARLTQSGIVAGTPMYMAPEQALGEALDERADLFSLGSVLYVLCTGREPFSGNGPMAVLRQVCEATPVPVRDLNPDVPAWLAAVIERLHAKRPADRFASAAEVADLLRYNLEHPDRPRPVPPHAPPRRARLRYWVAGAAVVAALLLAAGLTLSGALPWLYRPGAGQADRVPLLATLRGHTGTVWSVAFAPDGKTLATASDDASVRLWDVAAGREAGQLSGHGSAVLGVAFAHSGKFLVSGGGDGTLRLWDAATRQEQPPLLQHNGTVRRTPISPDDRTVAVANSTQGVELWDLERRELRRTLEGHGGSITAMAFAPDGGTLATGDNSGRVRLWDPATGEERAGFQGGPLGVRALAFSPDGRTLASAGNGDREVKLWDVATAEQAGTLAGYESPVLTLAISPDGRLLATGSRDGSVRVWQLASARVLATWHAHQESVYSLAFSPDGGTLATSGEDRLVKLWGLGGLDDVAP